MTKKKDRSQPRVGLSACPKDNSHLHDQKSHVSARILRGEERKTTQGMDHTRQLKQWRNKLSDKQKQMVEEAGFGELSKIENFQCDRGLVTAFVDRWRHETNTFHFRNFKATITLEDVVYILGLNVIGYPVYGRFSMDIKDAVQLYLGKEIPERGVKGQCIKLQWLLTEFNHKLPDTASEQEESQYTRAYILYLLGCTIFTDSGSVGISIRYLSLLATPSGSSQFAWGAAALAHFYRAMKKSVTSRRSKVLNGSIILLMCWIYERFPKLRPKDSDRICCIPVANKWSARGQSHTMHHNYDRIRDFLNSYDGKDFVWMPYKNCEVDESTLTIQLAATLGGKAQTWVIHYNECELHRPERVMRQFGLVQRKPEVPQIYARHGPAYPNKNWDKVLGLYVKQWKRFCKGLVPMVEGDDVDDPTVESGVVPGYHEWFSNITVPRIAAVNGDQELPYLAYQELRDVAIDLVGSLRPLLDLDAHPEIQRLMDTIEKFPTDLTSCKNTFQPPEVSHRDTSSMHNHNLVIPGGESPSPSRAAGSQRLRVRKKTARKKVQCTTTAETSEHPSPSVEAFDVSTDGLEDHGEGYTGAENECNPDNIGILETLSTRSGDQSMDPDNNISPGSDDLIISSLNKTAQASVLQNRVKWADGLILGAEKQAGLTTPKNGGTKGKGESSKTESAPTPLKKDPSVKPQKAPQRPVKSTIGTRSNLRSDTATKNQIMKDAEGGRVKDGKRKTPTYSDMLHQTRMSYANEEQKLAEKKKRLRKCNNSNQTTDVDSVGNMGVQGSARKRVASEGQEIKQGGDGAGASKVRPKRQCRLNSKQPLPGSSVDEPLDTEV